MSEEKVKKQKKLEVENVKSYVVSEEGLDRKTQINVYENAETGKKKFECQTTITERVDTGPQTGELQVPFREFIEAETVKEACKKFEKWIKKNKEKRIKAIKLQLGIRDSNIIIPKGMSPGQTIDLKGNPLGKKQKKR